MQIQHSSYVVEKPAHSKAQDVRIILFMRGPMAKFNLLARGVQFGDSQHRAFGRRNSRTTCDISLMDRLNEAAKQIRTLPLEANLWQTQNICYKILHTNWYDSKKKADLGDNNAQEWIRNYMVVADDLRLRVP